MEIKKNLTTMKVENQLNHKSLTSRISPTNQKIAKG